MQIRVVLGIAVAVSTVGSIGLLWFGAHKGGGVLCPLHHRTATRDSALDGALHPLRKTVVTNQISMPTQRDTSEMGARRGLPGSASCSGSDVELVVGVLASPTPRSTMARRVIRETWLNLPVPTGRVVVRFLLALNSTGLVPAAMLAEAETHGDMVFLDTLDAYKNLVRKVHLFFEWVAASCPNSARVFKTDDDSFVRLDKLFNLAKTLPPRRLYYGSFLRRMPARWRDKATKRLTNDPLAGNVQNMLEWPWYASGGGYMLSGDVVAALANPLLPRWHQTAEDRGVGVALFGYNVTYLSAGNYIKPWGTCHPDAVMLHYQRDPGLMQRRYSRSVAGANICGEGWAANQICVMIDQGKTGTIHCKAGFRIHKIMYADVGKHALATGYTGPCSEGPSAMLPEAKCVYTGSPTLLSILETKCVGQVRCTIRHDLRKLNLTDPCPGQFKRILAGVECR